MAAREQFFVTCAPGLEALVQAELAALRLAKVERQTGGVYFEGRLEDAWRANLWLRTGVRVLWRLARFEARDADALYRGVQAIEWSRFLGPEGTLVVDAQSTGSALEHTQFVAQRTKDAIVDQMREASGARPAVDKEDPDLRVHLHLHRDRATLALDSSGESLHKRGWRRHQGRAPLAETLAAAIVELSGWDRRSPLVDPFCGGGTILIEAALRAENVAPGLFRERFGFERWRGHDAPAWAKLRERARAQRTPVPKLVLVGSDIDAARLREAEENAAGAGLAGRIAFECRDAADFVPKRGWNAWIVTNPPYGERLGEERALAALHGGFGARLREHGAGWVLALLTGNPRFAAALNLPSARRIALMNGALECELLVAAL